MSNGPDDGYFADGLTEEVLNSLAQLPELLVTARTSAFAFKNEELTVQEIATRLGVDHIVEGSVRRSGDRLRVTAQLIRASDGFHVESNNYDSSSADTIAVQEDDDKGVFMTTDVYEFEVQTISGDQVRLSEYEDKVMLIVNTASKCGFTPQYEGLETLYQEYKDQGLVILGFPCNQFGRQEPGSESDIAEFCQLNYGVSFPMFAKVDVNGDDADPLFKYLKKSQKGLLGSEKIKWNFTKFLVNRDGEVVERFAPTAKPKDLEKDIESLL